MNINYFLIAPLLLLWKQHWLCQCWVGCWSDKTAVFESIARGIRKPGIMEVFLWKLSILLFFR